MRVQVARLIFFVIAVVVVMTLAGALAWASHTPFIDNLVWVTLGIVTWREARDIE